MKSLQISFCLLLTLPLLAFAGGNSSIVEISRVTEIKVESDKITIKGPAVVKRRVMSTKEKGDASVFGQPAQWLHAKVDDGVFQIVPYFTPNIEGVPTGGHSQEELNALSKKWWVGTHEAASKIKVGDRIQIGYQGDVTTINGFQVIKMVGYGTTSITQAKDQ